MKNNSKTREHDVNLELMAMFDEKDGDDGKKVMSHTYEKAAGRLERTSRKRSRVRRNHA